MADFQDVILRFRAEDEEGKESLRDLAALLVAVGQSEADPTVELHGATEVMLDLGKIAALMKTMDGQRAEPVIRPKTDEGRRALELFTRSINELNELHAEVRLDVDTSALKDAQEEVRSLQKKLARQRKSLEKFSASDQFSIAGGRTRAARITKTEKELEAATAIFEKLKKEVSEGLEVKMTTLEARTALELLRRRLEELGKLVTSPEVKLEAEQAQRAAARIRAVMQEITRLKSHAEVDLHDEKFQQKIRLLTLEMRKLEAEIVTPKIELFGEEDTREEVEQVVAFLKLLGQMEAHPRVQVEGTGESINLMDAVARRVDELERNSKVDLDINVKGRVESQGGILKALANSFKNAQEAAAGFSDQLGSVGVRVFGLSLTLGVASAALIAFLAAIALLVVGGLAALASSALLAAGAIAALATALGASLVPGLVLAIAAAASLSRVMKVLQAREAARLQAQQDQITGGGALASALAAEEDAARNLERANQSLADATVRAYREMEDAAEAASDAVRSLARAQLSLEGAKLSTDEAQFALEEFRKEVGLTADTFDQLFKRITDIDVDSSELDRLLSSLSPGELGEEDQLRLRRLVLDVREARLGEKEAVDGVSDATRNLNRANEENVKFQREGISASSQYVAALQAREDAERAVARAAKATDVTRSTAKAIALTQELTKEEERLADAIDKVKTSFNEAFAGATGGLFTAFIKLLEAAPGIFKAIAPAVQAFGAAMGVMVRSLGQELIKPGTVKAFNEFAKAGILISGPVTRGIVALFKILGRVALAMLPHLVDFAERFATKLEEWAKWTGEGDNLTKLVETMVQNLELWLDIAFQLARVFVGFLTSAEGPGQRLATSLRDTLKNLGDTLSTTEGRQELTDWLDQAAKSTKDLAEALKDIVLALGNIGEQVGPLTASLPALTSGFGLLSDVFASGGNSVKLAWEVVDRLMGKIFGKERWNKLKEQLVQGLNIILLEFALFALDFFKIGYDFGKNLISGLISGLQDMWNEGKEGFLEIMKEIAKTPLKMFLIGSPSKLFYGYGENIMRGFMEGLESQKLALTGALDASLSVPTLRALPATGQLSGAPAGGGGGGDVNIDKLILPPPPQGGVPDARYAAVQFASEMRRRGAR